MKVFILLSAMFLSLPAFAESVKVKVNGMVCAFCAQGISKSFGKEAAVEKVDVNLDRKLVELVLKKDQKLEDEKIKTIIKDAGYETVSIERVK